MDSLGRKSLKLSEIAESSGVTFGTSGARGLVEKMSDVVCYAYAQAFLRTVAGDARRIVIGHDLRPSSPTIAAVCARAVSDAGRQAVFVGVLPTPAVACYAASLDAPAIVVTGSHIPFDRNGIKFYGAGGEISKPDEQAMLAAPIDVPAVMTVAPLPAAEPAAMTAYVRRYADFFGAGALEGLRIAVYEHSSVVRDVLRPILQTLGASVLSLGRTDTFVPIDTEAVRQEDVDQARAWAGEHEFDAILSADGDADRPLIGDEQGNWLRGDIVGILCAQFLQADIVVTPVSSNTAVERCESFRRVVRTRIGSPYVIAAMESAVVAALAQDGIPEQPVVVGYEANGGFLLGSDIRRGDVTLGALPTRDAVLPMLALLSMARSRQCKLSELASHLPARYTASDRLQAFPTEKSRALLASLSSDAAEVSGTLAPDAGAVVQVDTLDGLRMTFANGDIVHLRPSGNAPELRCYAEADIEARAQLLCQRALQAIRNL